MNAVSTRLSYIAKYELPRHTPSAVRAQSPGTLGRARGRIRPRSVHHIGGLSIRTLESAPSFGMRLKSRIRPAVVKLRQWARGLQPAEHQSQQQLVAADPERAAFRASRANRAPAGIYFWQLLQALFEDRPLPAIPRLAEREIQERIESVAADIVALYEEFGEQLTGYVGR